MGGAAGPDVRKGHSRTTVACAAEVRGTMPAMTKGEGACSILPKELTQAGGDVNSPQGLEMSQQVNMGVKDLMEIGEPFEVEGSEFRAKEGRGDTGPDYKISQVG